MGGLRAPAQGSGRLPVGSLAEASLQLLQGCDESGVKQTPQQVFYKYYFFVYSRVVTFGVEGTSETLKVFVVFFIV